MQLPRRSMIVARLLGCVLSGQVALAPADPAAEIRADPFTVVFEFAPSRSPVELGRDIGFNGHFRVSDAERALQLRITPLQVAWRIVKRGTAITVLQGAVRVSGPRTPLRIRTRPAEAGVYELVFELPAPSMGTVLQIEHAERNRIEVVAP